MEREEEEEMSRYDRWKRRWMRLEEEEGRERERGRRDRDDMIRIRGGEEEGRRRKKEIDIVYMRRVDEVG